MATTVTEGTAIASASSGGPLKDSVAGTAVAEPRPLSPSQVQLKEAIQRSEDSLIEALGLAGTEEKSLSSRLDSFKRGVGAALEQLTVITTHDDNLERQYKDTVSENAQLSVALERARREIRHLKGQLSVLQMTSSEIREHRARNREREQKRLEHERRMAAAQQHQQEQHNKHAGDIVPVLSFAERARTVNAQGEYVDHCAVVHKQRGRRLTYPLQSKGDNNNNNNLTNANSINTEAVTGIPATFPPLKHSPPRGGAGGGGSNVPELAPPLVGCGCSECRAPQSLGALTLPRARDQGRSTVTRSGQQVIISDRVIIKGERLGTVKYIGKLEFDFMDLLYVGIQLDSPVGVCDGSLRGRRYFQAPPNHGVFVRPSEILCVTGRTPNMAGTAMPRPRERVPTGTEIVRSVRKRDPDALPDVIPHSTGAAGSSVTSSATPSHIKKKVESELAQLREKGVSELADASVLQMSHRMELLAKKSKRTRSYSFEDGRPPLVPSTLHS